MSWLPILLWLLFITLGNLVIAKPRLCWCEFPNCTDPEGREIHIGTAYVDEERNLMTLCPEHEEYVLDCVAEQWREYYSGCL